VTFEMRLPFEDEGSPKRDSNGGSKMTRPTPDKRGDRVLSEPAALADRDVGRVLLDPADTEPVLLKPDTTYDLPDTTYDLPGAANVLPDAAARRAAVDPSQNVVLEASAGTGKTRVLV